MKLPLNKYPYLIRNSEILRGDVIIEGTRIPVRTIAALYQMGQSIDELLITWNELEPAQVLSALAYYFDYQEEIDNDNEYNNNIEFWNDSIKKIKENFRINNAKTEIPA